MLLRDIVGKAEAVFVEGIGPLHRHFDLHPVALSSNQNGRIDQCGLFAIQIVHKGFKPTLVVQFHALLWGVALVNQLDFQA